MHPQYTNYLILDYFQHIEYKVDALWKPKKVRALIIAESPPWNDQRHYFYDAETESIFTRHIFDLLHIEGKNKQDKLTNFMAKGYFVIDTINAIFKKDLHSIPISLIHWCAQHIVINEIQFLNPEMILSLGDTAFRGLRSISPFNVHLKPFHSLKSIANQKLWINEILCAFSPYPNDRNRPYQSAINYAFSTIIEKGS